MPSSYTDPALAARTPNLRALAADGVWADGVVGVLPTVTYPSHTTLITGVEPARHGIYDNRIFDPEDQLERRVVLVCRRHQGADAADGGARARPARRRR